MFLCVCLIVFLPQGSRLAVRRTHDLSLLHVYDAAQGVTSPPTPTPVLLTAPSWPGAALLAGLTRAHIDTRSTVQHPSSARSRDETENGSSRELGVGVGANAPTAVSGAQAICALSLSVENHHAFVATACGGLRVYANPLVNIEVLEKLASELLNL